jgi:hypothetical protein
MGWWNSNLDLNSHESGGIAEFGWLYAHDVVMFRFWWLFFVIGLTFAEKCRFCLGTGSVTLELGGDDKEVSPCINCEGVGSLTCTTCQGSGIQPRYLDRRYESSNHVPYTQKKTLMAALYI